MQAAQVNNIHLSPCKLYCSNFGDVPMETWNKLQKLENSF